MRGMVTAVVVDGICPGRWESDLVGRVLRPGTLLKLSPLHGDDLPGLPHASRLRQIQGRHGLFHGVSGCRSDRCAPVISNRAMVVHTLHHVESMALHGPEFRA